VARLPLPELASVHEWNGLHPGIVREADGQRKRVLAMFDFTALDLVMRQRRDLERRAAYAALVREARPRRTRGGVRNRRAR
jgi:hypothetical protein